MNQRSECCNAEMSYIGENEHKCHSCGKVWDLDDITDPAIPPQSVEDKLSGIPDDKHISISVGELKALITEARLDTAKAIWRLSDSTGVVPIKDVELVIQGLQGELTASKEDSEQTPLSV